MSASTMLWSGFGKLEAAAAGIDDAKAGEPPRDTSNWGTTLTEVYLAAYTRERQHLESTADD